MSEKVTGCDHQNLVRGQVATGVDVHYLGVCHALAKLSN